MEPDKVVACTSLPQNQTGLPRPSGTAEDQSSIENGVVSGTLSIGSTNWTTGIYLGSDPGTTTGNFHGDIAETDIYTGAMSNATAATIGSALCSTYGVTCGASW
jgi:hypothetical protein